VKVEFVQNDADGIAMATYSIEALKTMSTKDFDETKTSMQDQIEFALRFRDTESSTKPTSKNSNSLATDESSKKDLQLRVTNEWSLQRPAGRYK